MTQLLIEIAAWIAALTLVTHLSLETLMNFSEYQQQAEGTFQIPTSIESSLTYITWVLGVSAKAGELSWRVTQLINSNDGEMDYQTTLQIMDVLGFLLWNMSQLASELQIGLDDIAVSNLQRLAQLNNS